MHIFIGRGEKPGRRGRHGAQERRPNWRMKQKIQKMSSKSYIVDMYVHSTTYENCIRRKNTTLALRVEEGRPQKGLLEDRGLLCVWQGEMH
jgi:hypothetical protein